MNKINSALSNVQTDLAFKNDVVVFCHLRWEFVIQRPQHLINRISKGRKVLFVEEPIGYDDSNYGTTNIYKPTENITVLQPRISNDNFNQELSEIVNSNLQKMNIKDPVLWFYSGAFSSVIENIPHSLVVYDCMDELSLFKGASQELINQEKYLLSKAEVVFTGGMSLAESKSKKHPNVFCFPSSVDSNHFKKALDKKTKIPDDIKKIKGPIVGYYGVIDERIDLSLIDDIARKMPKVSFVMIGPVVKIEENDLPRHNNLHYLGSKHYDELPNYLKAIDVTMMPFALNDSTKYISPTKTLEYMAAQKPIVSTPIKDVVRSYSNQVAISENSFNFMNSIWLYLNENSKLRKQRIDLYKETLSKTSWDTTSSEMKKIISLALKEKKLSSKATFSNKLKLEVS